MEALAAVGLAGNIVQFIDFSSKLFEQTTSIYLSHSGISADAQSVESITQDLQNLTARLSRGRQSTTLQQDETDLYKVARECQDVATELLSILEELKAKKPNSKWSSFKSALASTSRQSRIQALEKRLDKYRSQIIIQLQIIRDNKTSAFFGMMNELDQKSQRMGLCLKDQICALRRDVQNAIEKMTLGLADQHATRSTEEHTSTVTINVSALAQSLIQSEPSGTDMAVSLALLESLTFAQMDYRHAKVCEAHPKTFQEVYEEKIVRWLQSSESMFWISGKPGSGKSTLMKYIVDNPATRIKLQEAMNGQTPRVASYFFWINGTDLQRSQEGLLQSLLHELLRQSPDMIKAALPESWHSMTALLQKRQTPDSLWKRADLLSAIERLAKCKVTATKLCVFIDGLDEYGGDPDDLIDTIRHIESMDVKVCIASRPWNVFEQAFGLDQGCKIYLQDLNKPDIELYVHDKLRNRAEFQKLRIDTTDADDVMEEIVEKSQGVFLWVFLVVRSLIEGLRNHDRLSQLQKRLRDFPSDLEHFFGHIFESMDPTYHSQTAHMFQVALHAKIAPSPLMYWFLDELEDEPNLALTLPIQALTMKELNGRIETSKIRINGRCKGLLEVTWGGAYEERLCVDFLHRTVRDFFRTTKIRGIFEDWQLSEFDPDMAICKASLAEFKVVATMTSARVNDVECLLENFFHAAKELEMRTQQTPALHLDEIERVGNSCQGDKDPPAVYWGPYPWELMGGQNFVHVAVRSDLLLFIPSRCHDLRSLFNDDPRKDLFYIDVSLDMVRLVLSSVSSLGPPPKIGPRAELSLTNFLHGRNDELLWMTEICTYASFRNVWVGPELDEILRKNLSADKMEYLKGLSLKRWEERKRWTNEKQRKWSRKKALHTVKASESEATARGSSRGAANYIQEVQKQGKRRSFFRKLLGR